MAITDYTSLKAKVARWLGRDDLIEDIPDFIQLAEEDIAALLRSEVVRAALTLDSDAVALPADCGELRSIRFDTDTRKYPLNITTDVNLATLRRSGSGVPNAAAVVDGTLLLDITPSPSVTTEITYYDALVPLSDTNPTNAVLTSSARIYLYGAMREAELFLEHDERAATIWEPKFLKAIADENLARERAELAAAPTVRRLPVVFG